MVLENIALWQPSVLWRHRPGNRDYKSGPVDPPFKYDKKNDEFTGTSPNITIGEKAKNIIILAGILFRESIEGARVFVMGVGNAYVTDNMLGVGRGDPRKFGYFSTQAARGQQLGDFLAMLSGSVETAVGSVGEGVGGLLEATGIFIPAGVGIKVASTAVVIHGASVITTALHAQAVDNSINDNGNGSDGSGGSGGGENNHVGDVNFTEQDRDVFAFEVKVGNENINGISHYKLENGKLHLNEFHIGGSKNQAGLVKEIWRKLYND